MRKYLVVSIILPWLLVPMTESVAQFLRLDTPSAAAIEVAVTEFMQQRNIVGCSVGAILDGQIVYLDGFGYSDREAAIPATEYTIYRTGSVAKSFTAITAMQLVETRQLDLQTDVRNYVPEYPEKPQGTITPYRLLAHRSGIRHYEEYEADPAIYYERDHFEYDPIAALDVFKNGSLLFKPGTQYSYTTFGYNLLGAAVERAGNEPFLSQVRRRINHVLDLPYLQAEYQRKRPYPNETAGYHMDNGSLVRTPDDIGILFKVPGGGFLCTVIDLTLLTKGWMEYSLFADSTTQDWMSIDHSGGNDFGLGIINGQHRGRPYLWHAGGQQRTATIYLYYPDSNNGVAIMTNTWGAWLVELALSILDVLESASLEGEEYTHIPHRLQTPMQISPSGNESVNGSSVELSWQPVPHAFTYVCETGNDPSLSLPRRDTVKSPTLDLKGLRENEAVYWRVQALNTFLYDTTVSDWSETRRFTVTNTTSTWPLSRAEPVAISIYPNPSTGVVSIESSQRQSLIERIEVYNLRGRLLQVHHAGAASIRIDLSDYVMQPLFLRVSTTDGYTTHETLIIQP